MLYTTLKVGDKEYKCRLTTKSFVELEKKLGTNPLNVLMAMDDKSLPPLGSLLAIVHASLQTLEHGISMDDVYDIYDAYCADGKTIGDLVWFIHDLLVDSGMMPKVEDKEEVKPKNYKVVEK